MLILLYAALMLLCFVFLARICDRFFVDSLDRIAADLKLSNEAAGATLMAVGSSAPELFVSLFSVLRPGNHAAIGIGSIVGSALFNLLAIIGVVALVKKTRLTWQPVLRDILFYAISVGLLLYVIFDGSFDLKNAILFLFIYVVYVVAVINWRRLFPYDDSDYHPDFSVEEERPISGNSIIDRLLLALFPARKNYYLVFVEAILWIAGLSWGLVEMAIHISVLLHISEAIIALTVLAIGTSVPDLISSVIVARQGRGDMAVSNAVGSNIFDILVGLGLPFLISVLISGRPITAQHQNLVASAVILFASVVVFVALLLMKHWKIGWVTGAVLLGLYLAYLVREIIILL